MPQRHLIPVSAFEAQGRHYFCLTNHKELRKVARSCIKIDFDCLVNSHKETQMKDVQTML